jgi:hypothetical protein
LYRIDKSHKTAGSTDNDYEDGDDGDGDDDDDDYRGPTH